jgi:hypothetical protein
MRLVWFVIGLVLALAGLLELRFVPAKSVRAADNGQDPPGFHREVVGNNLISIKPLVESVPDQRPVRRMSEEDLQRLELEKNRSGIPRLPDKDERELQREAAADGRPARLLSETERRRLEENRNRPGPRLVYRPAPGQGEDRIEEIQ